MDIELNNFFFFHISTTVLEIEGKILNEKKNITKPSKKKMIVIYFLFLCSFTFSTFQVDTPSRRELSFLWKLLFQNKDF